MPSTAGVNFTRFASWADAKSEAAKQGKYLFVDAMTDWCGWCKEMDKRTFSDAEVASQMNKKFVCTKIEMETDWGIDVAMKYRVVSFPQFLVFNPAGELVYRMVGFQTPDQFLQELARAQAPSSQQHYPGISATMNLPWPPFLRVAFAKGKQRAMPTAQEASRWLNEQTDPSGEVPFTVMVRCPIGPKWQQWIVDNQVALSGLYGQEATDKAFTIAMEWGTEALEKGDTEGVDRAIGALRIDNENYNAAVTHLRMEQHIRKGDWKGAMVYLRKEQQAGHVPANVANQFCWRAYEETMDHDACVLAAEVMEHVDKAKEYALWDTYAAVLFKSGRNADARNAAHQAITFGEHEGADVSTTKALLQAIETKH